MVKLIVKEKEYEIPTSFKEMSVEKLIEITNVNEEGIFAKSKEYLKIFVEDLDDDEIDNISIESFNKIVDLFSYIDIDIANITEEKEIEIDGIIYAYPSTFEEIKLGEWVDSEYVINQSLKQGKKNAIFDNIHKLMAIYVRQKGEKYNSNNNKKREELFLEKINAEYAINFANFFLKIAMGYMFHIVTSLVAKAKEEEVEKQHITLDGLV